MDKRQTARGMTRPKSKRELEANVVAKYETLLTDCRTLLREVAPRIELYVIPVKGQELQESCNRLIVSIDAALAAHTKEKR